jgi:hypothetical protein
MQISESLPYQNRTKRAEEFMGYMEISFKAQCKLGFITDQYG